MAKKKEDRKPFKIWVRWGEESTQRDNYPNPRCASEYEFATEAELNAFIEGVNEGVGYMDCTTFLSEAELKAEPGRWSK